MSQPEQNEDETQLEIQTDEEMQDVETQELELGNLQEDEEVAPPRKRKKIEKDVLVREPGKTLLPMSRVQKIIKADKVYRNASFICMTG